MIAGTRCGARAEPHRSARNADVPQSLRAADRAQAPPLPLSIVPLPATTVSRRRLAAASALIVPLIATAPSWTARSVVNVTLLFSTTLPAMLMLLPATSAVLTLVVRYVVAAVTVTLASPATLPTAAPRVAVEVPALMVKLRGVASESIVARPAAVNATAPPAPVDVPVPPKLKIVTCAPSVVGSLNVTLPPAPPPRPHPCRPAR